MAELFNLHTAPVTVTDAVTGKRVTIPRGHSALVAGDFRDHLFVKAQLLRAEYDESDEALGKQQDDESTPDIVELRARYEEVLGKKAPSAAKAETLQKAIDEALGKQQDEEPTPDIVELRARYEEVLGKKAPSAAKAETLQKAIDEALGKQPDPSGGTTETE